MGSDLHNLYGPTEASIDVTSYSYDPEDSGVSVPIGRPISNTQMYILDQNQSPVPIGVSGEIYIGGVGLARGYLNRPDLTAEKFIPNPFATEKNLKEGKSLRLYRTGDLARYLPDGNIEFLGRIDDQVKIRGFRIELGEIESTLSQHGDVTQAVVIAREDEPGDKKLVAYVIPQERLLSSLEQETLLSSSSHQEFAVLQGESLPGLTETLRNHLSRSLPDYMVPAFFVFLDKIPLTSNGKIDRKSLPAPDLSLRQVGEDYVAPTTPIEQELCAIWSEVLRIEKIGIHDNFFRIGGDSIISIQIVAKARQKNIFFAVKDIFNSPTIGGLSLVARAQEDLLTLKPEQGLVSGDIPLTPIQHRFFEQQLKNPHHYNQVTLLQARDPIDTSLFSQAFDLLISHHDVLRCRYHQESSGTWKQTNLSQEDLSTLWTVVDLSSVSDQDLSSHIEHEATLVHESLDIEKGPLLKVALFNCGSRPSRLLIVIHHLAVDGVSWRILLEDFEKVYQSLKEGKVPSLPKKTHSFQQWGHSVVQYAQSEEIKKELPYWRNIEDSLSLLPVDFNKGPCTGEDVETLAVSLTQEETTSLLQTVPKAYRTQINDILLTALTLAIGDWTQDYTLSLDLEGHGREEDIIADMDLSRTIGWFTSVFPVHLSLENPEDLGESIKTIKETLREIPHKGVGYGILKYLSSGKPLSSSSVNPSLSFNYLGQWDNTLSQVGPFTPAYESAGNPIAAHNTVSHLLNINGEVRENILHVFWSYSTHHYKAETIERVTSAFINRLKQLIEHCSQEENFGYTLSDFNLLSLSQLALDKSFGSIPRIESIYPLSPMQSGLLFQALYAPASDAYFVQIVFELEGDVEVDVLEAAWQKVSDHHPILRTGFIWEGLETPLQYV
jgi:non-ribosomal peptide synthase protein (TIGR01720 family)